MIVLRVVHLDRVFTISKFIEQKLSASFESIFGHFFVEGSKKDFVLVWLGVKGLVYIKREVLGGFVNWNSLYLILARANFEVKIVYILFKVTFN